MKFSTHSIACAFVLVLLPPDFGIAQAKFEAGGYLQNWIVADQEAELIDSNGAISTSRIQNFKIRRARLMGKGTINDVFSATTWLEFAGDTPSLLDFYLNASISPQFNGRVGQMVMPGQSFTTSRRGSAALHFYDRPTIARQTGSLMGFDAFRDIGVMAYGQVGKLWYGFHISNGTGRYSGEASISERKAGSGMIGGRVDFEVIDGLIVGGHASLNRQRDIVRNQSEPFDMNRSSYSLRASVDHLVIDKLFAQAEYMQVKSDDKNWDIQTDTNENSTISGFYTEVGYRLTPEWHVLGRYNENSTKLDYTVENDRFESNPFTLGLTRFFRYEEQEIVRVHLNYSFAKSDPMNLSDSILLLVFQLQFYP